MKRRARVCIVQIKLHILSAFVAVEPPRQVTGERTVYKEAREGGLSRIEARDRGLKQRAECRVDGPGGVYAAKGGMLFPDRTIGDISKQSNGDISKKRAPLFDFPKQSLLAHSSPQPWTLLFSAESTDSRMKLLPVDVVCHVPRCRRRPQPLLGQVFLGVHTVAGKEVAIKLEPAIAKHSPLKQESKIYKTLMGGTGVPWVMWSGRQGDYNVMVIDLLGPSLEDLFKMCNRHFSLKTVLLLTDQLVSWTSLGGMAPAHSTLNRFRASSSSTHMASSTATSSPQTLSWAQARPRAWSMSSTLGSLKNSATRGRSSIFPTSKTTFMASGRPYSPP